MKYGIYDTNGRITRVVTCPALQSSAQVQGGEYLYEGGCDQKLHYIVDGALANRPSMSLTQIDKTEVLAGGVEVVTISNIPVDTVARVKGGGAVATSEPITDGNLELSFDTEGAYRVRLVMFPYRDKEFVINAS